MARAYIGLSGYSYKPWQGEDRFYPEGLKQSQFLQFYAGRYPAVEMDGSWYKTPTAENITQWIDGSPDGFQYSFKLHRRITHMGRLKPETYEGVHYFLRRVYPMAKAGKLGAHLIQLPPSLRRNDDRLDAFLAALPKDFAEVHDLDVPAGTIPRWSVEFRHESWNCQEVDDILRRYGVAWVASDRDEARADRRDTAGHIHARLRRTDTDDALLSEWAEYFRKHLAAGKDCFIYCKHEDDGSPWEWADSLLLKLS